MDDLRERRPDLNPPSVMFGRAGKSGLLNVMNADVSEPRPTIQNIARKVCMMIIVYRLYAILKL